MIVYEAAGQIYIFLSCVFLGAALGVLWQLTHLPTALCGMSKRTKWFKAVVSLADVLFCVFSLPVVLFGLIWICYGSIRLYCFLGILAGFFLWLRTTGLIVDRFAARMYNYVVKKVLLRKTEKDNDGQQDNQKN